MMPTPRTHSSPALFTGRVSPEGPTTLTSTFATGRPSVSTRISSGSFGELTMIVEPDSVIPYPIRALVLPSSDMILRMISGGINAPDEITVLREGHTAIRAHQNPCQQGESR